jgi:transcription elongation factor Elf1
MTMDVSIRKGYSVWSNEPERIRELERLESAGILTLNQDKWLNCRKCGTANMVDKNFELEKVSTCTNCGKTIQLSRNTLTRRAVSSINYQKIMEVCGEKLIKDVGKENCVFDRDQRIWLCSRNGKRIPVFISQISSYNQHTSEQSDFSWLCIVLDWEKEKGIVNYYNELHFVRIEDIIDDRIGLDDVIDRLTTSFAPSVTLELSRRFDSYLSSISPSEFEKNFVDQFLNGLKEKVDLLKRFFDFLSSRRNTIINAKVILIGGPANPDFALINLLEYLQEGLKPDKIGEAKRYCRSEFTVSDFGTAQAHAVGEDTVCIVSTNRIQPEVWRLILETKNKEGYFKHVVIEKDTIVLLMSILNMGNLLSQSWKG